MESRGAAHSTNLIPQSLRLGAHLIRRSRLVTGVVALAAALGLHVTSWAAPAAAVDLISANIRGISGNGAGNGVSLSTDGSIVAFYSDATDLVTNDTNQVRDVFVRNSNTGNTERASVSTPGAPGCPAGNCQANGPSQSRGMAPAISDNGEIVAFYSDASNLVPNDNNGLTDVFVRDRAAGTTTLVSANAGGTSANGVSLFPSISADGHLVAFQSSATDLVAGGTPGLTDIYVRDVQAGTTERLCGVQPNASSFSAAISGDGNIVAFVSAATNLGFAVTGGFLNVYTCDRRTNSIDLISVSSANVLANGDNMAPAINFDGTVVAFKSEADNLVANDSNGLVDVFARDRAKGTTERISVSFTGGNSNDVSFPPAISYDGRFVVFGSAATNLVHNDANGVSDVFVRDRQGGVTVLVDLGPNGQQANGGTPDVPPAISGDGLQIGFISFATNLVSNDHNLLSDVFATENPLICSNGTTCPTGLICVNDFCVLPTPTPTVTATPTATSKTPSATPTVTWTPTPQPTSTPTSTPTPIACIGIEDCPSGQICVEGFCVFPTPTPTPIACTDSSQCPEGLICLNGICQPAQSPTPTQTPTPLPTCATDADCARACSADTDCHADQTCVSGQCSPADRCVDGVCAPTRLCNSADPTTCIASRETCLNGTCECGGDCNLDGFVFADEVAKMICILTEQCQISECEAGDFDRNGVIMGNEVCQAVTNLGNGCPLGIQNTGAAPLAPDTTEPRPLTLTGPAQSVSPGQTISIQVALGGPEETADVATAQLDLLFDTTALSLTDPNVACVVDTRLSATDTSFSFMPRRPGTPDNIERIRLFVANLNVCNPNEAITSTPFAAGSLLTCSFHVNPTAAAGQTTVTAERTNLGDVQGNQIPSTGSSTDITIVQQTCTVDADCNPGLHCRAGVCTAIRPCVGSAQCVVGREACVTENGAGVCECGGDCNLDGRVRADEVTTLVNVFIGSDPLSLCPADDITGDTHVRADEVTDVTINFVNGCP